MGKVLIQGDWLDGFSSGKKAALLDWQHRREKKEFALICNRLRALKWARENPERHRINVHRYISKPEVKAQHRVRQKAWRRKRVIAKSIVFTCGQCGSVWCKAPWTKGPKPNFCSERCQTKHRYHHDESFRERMKANARAQNAKKSKR